MGLDNAAVNPSNFHYFKHQKNCALRSFFGGRGWIRTTEAISSRFTVCPLWPLGNSPKYGAGDGTRTRDLLITNQLLYQLSYTSTQYLID